ncbi:MAG: hypothetical protein SFW67_35420, partial [Myxococcaceae bacterium]|nr:hypothetical protein [Myxococcaceae bacterium]
GTWTVGVRAVSSARWGCLVRTETEEALRTALRTEDREQVLFEALAREEDEHSCTLAALVARERSLAYVLLQLRAMAARYRDARRLLETLQAQTPKRLHPAVPVEVTRD